MRPSHGFLSLCLPALFVVVPARADALECFQATAGQSSLASDPAAGHGTALPVTLATTLRLNTRCAYGLLSDSGRMVPVPAGETDFNTLAAVLTAAAHGDPATRPRTLYARPTGHPDAPAESVFRESCTESLVADRGAFDTHVDTATGALVVTRATAPTTAPGGTVPASDCGASRTVLRFVPVQSPADAVPGLSNGPAPFTLDPVSRSISLGRGGEFAVYAARTPTATGLLVGHVGRSDPWTALRHALATPSSVAAPWFVPRWSPQGDFELDRADTLRQEGDIWPEMVTAAAADALWLADIPGDNRSDDTASLRGAHAPQVRGPMHVGSHGDTVVLPPELVTAAMTARFGPQGRSIVPTLDEWDALRRGLQLCLVDRYAPERLATPQRVPDGALCARLAHLAAPVILPVVQAAVATLGTLQGATPSPAATRRVCLHRARWEIGTAGAARGTALPEVCVNLPGSAQPPDAPPDPSPTNDPLPTVMVGDRLAPEGPSTDLYACIDNHCRPLQTEITVWQQGLVEVRSAPSVEAADHALGVTLVRMAALDVLAGWLPVGLYTGSHGVGANGYNPWAALDHDEPAVFSFIRRRQALVFHLAASPTVAAVWNARALAAGQGAVLTETLPVVGGLAGTPAAPSQSALVVLVSRDDRCPTEPSVAVRAAVPVDPDALLVDQRFHVFLARAMEDSSPYECLAHAAFRVRESRAVAMMPWLHAGLWGDTQAAVFLTDPSALGVIQPLAYLHARLPWGFGADAAADLTAAVTFDHAEVSRAGVGLALAVGWGPPTLAPRLVSVGAMVHVATGTAAINPVFSPYVALDLATLFDAAGGR